MIPNDATPVNEYPAQFWQALDEYVSGPHQTPLVAVFDADGTLWDTDVGEIFFQYQMDSQALRLPNDPWGYYEGLKAQGRNPEAYLWLAQISAGQKIDQVRQWATDCFAQQKIPVFQPQLRLINWLQDHDVDVYIVSASIQWAVEAAIAKCFRIPRENVIGVKTAIDSQGRVTEQQDGPITWREGKREGLLSLTNGRFPFLSVGNTNGDQHLLEIASPFPVAVRSSSTEGELKSTELMLQEVAKGNGWWHHEF